MQFQNQHLKTATESSISLLQLPPLPRRLHPRPPGPGRESRRKSILLCHPVNNKSDAIQQNGCTIISDDVALRSVQQRTLTKGELESLIERVGRTRTVRLAWALKFAQTDLARLMPGDRDNLTVELSAFIELADHGDFTSSFIPPENETLRIIPFKLVRAVHRSFGRVLASFEREQCAELGPFKIGYFLQLPDWVFKEWKRRGKHQLDEVVGAYFESSRQQRLLYGDTDQVALLGFGQLLDQFLSELRKCPDEKCGKWFVAWRSNQEYCTRTCKSRSATRAKRARDRKKARTKAKP